MSDVDELHSLSERVAGALRARTETLALAESCTGGLIAAALTSVAGASDFFWGGAVVYSAEAKRSFTDIDQTDLDRHGSVSAETTAALARGVRNRSGATYGLAVTGWAGPFAASGQQLGEVHGALSHDGETLSRRWQFAGNRAHVRRQAARAAPQGLPDSPLARPRL